MSNVTDPSPDPGAERPIRITGCSGLVSAVPYLLGFEPSESIVVVFTRSSSGRVVLCLRVDAPTLPASELSDESGDVAVDDACVSLMLVSEIEAAVRRALAAGAPLEVAHIVHCTAEAAARPMTELVSALRSGLVAVGLIPGEWVAARGKRWWHYQCPLRDCCDREGHDCDDAEGTRAAFDLVTAGVSYAASREELARQLSTDPHRLLSADEMARACAEAVLHGVSQRSGLRWRRSREDEMAAACGVGSAAAAGVGAGPPDPLAARWVMGLQDARVREPLLHRLLFGGGKASRPLRLAAARAMLIDLVRRTPSPELAAVAATLAAVAWQQGDGAFARLASERALTADSHNTLAGLILRAATSGMPPAEWADLLSKYSPGMLRGTRPIPIDLGGQTQPEEEAHPHRLDEGGLPRAG